MRKGFVLVALCAALAGTAPAASAAEIGVILAGTRQVFWRTITAGITAAAADLKVGVVIRSPVDGAAIEGQSNIQLRFIDYLMQQGVAGIVLAPEPLTDVKTPVSIAVPTVLVDRSSTDYDAVSTVATDNFAAGRAAAESLDGVLSAGARVAVLRVAPNVTSTSARESGFFAVAQEKGWQVVLDAYIGHGFRESQELATEALSGHLGSLDAVFAPNETAAYGTLQALAGTPDDLRPRLVAFDWRPEYLAAIRQGALYATVVQDAYGMGYQAVATLVAATEGRQPPAQVAVDVVTVTQANLDDETVQALLAHYRE